MDPASDQNSAPAINRGLCMAAGIPPVLLGAVAIPVPAVAFLGVTIFTGCVLIMVSMADEQATREA